MLPVMLQPLRDLTLFDIADIAVVTVLLYTVLAWVRRSRATFVAAGLFLLAVLFVVARLAGLQLTAWILQGFFAVFIFVVIVVFQDELRQLFESIAVLGLRRRAAAPPPDVLGEIIRCAWELAGRRIGALIVFRGRQPIDRYLSGGIELDGRASGPILESIFDPHSAGHDGAVVIRSGRIERFAVHLPLSQDFRQLRGRGTRHAAALGLAEVSDALCLVVSEERGQVSVACGGVLQVMRDAGETRALLDAYVEDIAPPRRFWPRLAALRENLWEKVAAAAIAFSLWYILVPGSRIVENSFSLPVRVVNLPADLELRQVEPDRVTVTLAGPARSFYLFDPQRNEVTVDAALAALGRRTFRLAPGDISTPAELDVRRIEPDRVRISVERVSHAERTSPAA